MQNLDIYSSWGQNASQLGHPKNLRFPLDFHWTHASLQGVGECGRPQGRQVMRPTDLQIRKIERCTTRHCPVHMCQKWGGVHPIARFQVEVLRTLTKGAKISSDFQAQSCHCHVTIIVLVSTTCHPARVVLLLWKCGETQGVSDFWVERGGT